MSKTLKEIFIDLVEENFPKGRCKERGEALVLVAKAMIEIPKLIPNERKIEYRACPEGLDVDSEKNEGFNQCRKEMLKNMGADE